MHLPDADRLDTARLRQLFVRPVGIGIRRVGDRRPIRLWPAEERLLSPRALARRREQFALGRAAAHDALADLGVTPAPVGRGARGEPLWPAGIVGAITHAGGLGMAVVGRRDTYVGLGIDVEERSRTLSDAAARFVCLPAELAWAAGPHSALRYTMLFCAKEAIYKALYPVEQTYLGFHDAELRWQPETGTFVARLHKAAGAEFGVGHHLSVACFTLPDLVVAALAV